MLQLSTQSLVRSFLKPSNAIGIRIPHEFFTLSIDVVSSGVVLKVLLTSFIPWSGKEQEALALAAGRGMVEPLLPVRAGQPYMHIYEVRAKTRAWQLGMQHRAVSTVFAGLEDINSWNCSLECK